MLRVVRALRTASQSKHNLSEVADLCVFVSFVARDSQCFCLSSQYSSYLMVDYVIACYIL